MTHAWCSATTGGVRLALQIQPNAKKSGVARCFDGFLKIRLHAQPVDGKANEALIHYLADLLDVPKNAVSITHGHTAKRKTVEIMGSHLKVDLVRQTLSAPVSD